MKKSKRVISILLVFSLLMTVLAGCAGNTSGGKNTTPDTGGEADKGADSTPAGESYELVFATHLAENHPITQAMYLFTKRAEELSNGRLKFKTYINVELGDPTDVIDQIRIGVVDGGYFTTGHMAYYNNKLNATMWPYMFESYEHAAKAYDSEVGEYMKKMAADGGFKVIDWMYYGFRNMSTNKPINKVSDIKGLKLRVPAERVNQLTMTAFGAVCTTIAFNELYLALSQGVVDGQENPIATMDSANVQEVNKNIAMIEYTFFTTGMVMNPDKFNSLPADLQEVIIKASKEATAYERDTFVEAENKIIDKFKKDYKVTFTYPDKKEFVAAAQPALSELKKDYDEAFVKEWLALIEESKVK
ncbi:MAG TPA: TRAP transporter substrate-binding protein [Bacillota bacterium]|nr:TRAP transporter substrate-binding protein [Bacillota bacterium]HPL54360.1 TRAP transporter substrate-binding protein [Bacillota bacterium]